MLVWRINVDGNSKMFFNVQGSVYHKYIPIHIQQDATLHGLFMSGICPTYFRWYLHPSSGAHTTVSTASGTCQTFTATCRYRGRVVQRIYRVRRLNKYLTLKAQWLIFVPPVSSEHFRVQW